MDINDLPKPGRKFNPSINLSGRKSFKTKLTALSRLNSSYRNLNKENINTITTELVEPYKRAIVKKGGLSYRQFRKAKRTAVKLWRAGDENFSREDARDAVKILQNLKKSNQTPADPPKPSMVARRVFYDRMDRASGANPSSSNSVSSISQLINKPKNIPPAPATGTRPPRIPLAV